MAFHVSQKHLFYTEIAKLLEAGFGIREAAASMLDTKLPTAQAGLLEEMDRELEAGKSIAESFDSTNSMISPLERSVIGAGERGGRMAAAFQHLADYYGMLAAARREALRAMVYPMVLLHMGIFVGVLAPALMKGDSTMYEIVTRFVVTMLGVYLVGFLVFLGVRGLLATVPNSAPLDRFVSRIPVIGGALRAMAMARFTKVYHIGLLAGLSMKETVETAARASRSGVVSAAAKRLTATLESNGPLGPEFIASGAFPKAFARSYSTAEESGGLDKDMARWSLVYQDDAAKAVRTLSTVTAKVGTFLVMLFVAWTILRVFSGYYGMIDDVLNE